MHRVQADPQNGEYRRLRATVLQRLGRYDAAVRDYSAAIEWMAGQHLSVFEPLLNRGSTLLAAGRLAQAQADFDAAAASSFNSYAAKLCQVGRAVLGTAIMRMSLLLQHAATPCGFRFTQVLQRVGKGHRQA